MRDSDHNQHASFEKLLKPHMDRLYRMSFRLAGNKPEAEDLFQEVTENTETFSFGAFGPETSVLSVFSR